MQHSLFSFALATVLLSAYAATSSTQPQAPAPGFKESDCASVSAEVGPVVPQRPIAQRQPSAPRYGPPEGFACILVTIDTSGKVTQPRVVSTNSEGYARNFLAALAHWRYDPIVVDGKAVEVRTLVTAKYAVTPAAGPGSTR